MVTEDGDIGNAVYSVPIAIRVIQPIQNVLGFKQFCHLRTISHIPENNDKINTIIIRVILVIIYPVNCCVKSIG